MMRRIGRMLSRDKGPPAAGVRAETEEAAFPFRTRGRVHIIERNGGSVEVHATALLNSRAEGYHVGMPFETTLIADAPGARITVGEKTRIHGSYIHAWKEIVIGRGVLIAAGTNIVDANGHSANVRYARFRRHFRDTPQAIRIEDFAWIGMNCIILKGVTVGECAIVAAGSVVKEPVPPFSVVEGNPAKVVRVLDREKALEASFPIEALAAEEGYYEF